MAESSSSSPSPTKFDSNKIFNSIETCDSPPPVPQKNTFKPKSSNDSKEKDAIAAAQNNKLIKPISNPDNNAFSPSENEEMLTLLDDDNYITATHTTNVMTTTCCKKIFELSDDILCHIFSWCGVFDLGLIVPLVSCKWLQLSRDPCLWHHLYHRLYRKQQPHLPAALNNSTFWYNRVQIRYDRSIQLMSNLNSGRTDSIRSNGCIAIANSTSMTDAPETFHLLLNLQILQIQSIHTKIPIQSIFEIQIGVDPPIFDAVAYFEFELISGGASIGIVGLGDDRDANSPPPPDHIGWRSISYGYHNDDGKFYYNDNNPNNNQLTAYESFGFGPLWTPTTTTNTTTTTKESSFVAGCGLHLNTNQLFFTHNGTLITPTLRQPPKVKPLQSSYAAAVSLNEAGDHGELNFGSKGFKFDLEYYIYNKHKLVK